MITGAPAPSPTFLGSDSFLACGRLAFGCFRILTLGRVPLHWRPDPRTSCLGEATTRQEVHGSGRQCRGTRPSVRIRKQPKARRPQARKLSEPRNVGDGAGAPVIMIGDSRAAYVLTLKPA